MMLLCRVLPGRENAEKKERKSDVGYFPAGQSYICFADEKGGFQINHQSKQRGECEEHHQNVFHTEEDRDDRTQRGDHRPFCGTFHTAPTTFFLPAQLQTKTDEQRDDNRNRQIHCIIERRLHCSFRDQRKACTEKYHRGTKQECA